ncbi:MAG: hypothetical protein GX078_06975 [Clostridiales bacterium]|nr:hypothetical protein [Clostridiales bacterium]
MRKLIILITTLVLVFAITTVAYAAPSVQLGTPNVKAVDADGNAVEVVVEYVKDAAAAGPEYVAIKDTDEAFDLIKVKHPTITKADLRMISLMNVYVKNGEADIKWPLTLTFEVSSIGKTSKAFVLHFENQENWVVLDSVVGDGVVKAEFDSLSPVAIFADSSLINTEEAPKTGEGYMMYIIILAMVAGTSFLGVSLKKAE